MTGIPPHHAAQPQAAPGLFRIGRQRSRKPAPLWLLGLTALGAIVTAHIFIPALPFAAHTLGASARDMQLTVSIYIAGLAAGQLVYGPLADWLGQRRILMAGLAIYIAASIAAGLATSAPVLVAIRLVQSLGGGSGLVLARAIARRGCAPQEATRRQAMMNLVITLGPPLSPLVGGMIASLWGWRMIFALLALLGCLNLGGTWLLIPDGDRGGLDGRTVLRNYLRLLITPRFVAYSLAGGCFTTSMYALIGAAPFILVRQFGYTADRIGPVLAFATMGIWIGSIAASRLAHRLRTESLLMAGGLCVSASAFCLLLLVSQGWLTVPALVAIMGLFLFGVGLSGPPALTLAISVNPLATASGSGIYGATQMAVGAICSLGGALSGDPALGAARTVAMAAGLGLVAMAVNAMLHRRSAARPELS
ncbi:MFS transporter [Novosphingobium rosa]|uniref:MFS transporter n=1 Tax=Novosphingobium rosa TaxID=76978 RepID=UPI00082E7166|nr:MFS transporter [Novosphingobium rosa]